MSTNFTTVLVVLPNGKSNVVGLKAEATRVKLTNTEKQLEETNANKARADQHIREKELQDEILLEFYDMYRRNCIIYNYQKITSNLGSNPASKCPSYKLLVNLHFQESKLKLQNVQLIWLYSLNKSRNSNALPYLSLRICKKVEH